MYLKRPVCVREIYLSAHLTETAIKSAFPLLAFKVVEIEKCRVGFLFPNYGLNKKAERVVEGWTEAESVAESAKVR